MADKRRLMQGNEACVEGALAAGVRFFAGYPITPSTEIAEVMAERLPPTGGVFIQMEDEIASMGAVIGASLCGLKSMTATSGPGFSLKQENLGYASLAEIPCVMVNVQRVGPSTGRPTSVAQGDVMQARWGTHGDHPVVALCPSSVRETFDLTVEAFNISESLRVPVILLLDEVLGHMREPVELPDPVTLELKDRPRPLAPPGEREYLPYAAGDDLVPPMASYGEGYAFHVTGLFHNSAGFPTNDSAESERLLRRLMQKVEVRHHSISWAETQDTEDAGVVVVAYGSTARSAARAVKAAREAGIKAGLFRPLTIWPFPAHLLVRAEKARSFVVAEMNLGQLVYEVERHVCHRARVGRVNRAGGELLTPGEILEAIKEAAAWQ
ncbi:MAG: 2-oxoacid:acceptor oxidoreductase subunit alpha [Bacillota bacterium]